MAKKTKQRRLQYETADGFIIEVSKKVRDAKLQYYREKFFNKFLNKFKFDGLDYQQIHYMMKKFWDKNCGTLAFSTLRKSQSEENPSGVLLICPYSMAGVFNMYDFPTHAMLIDTHATGLFPTTPQEIDKDVVIGWITRTHKGVYSLIEEKVEELVDIDMTIRCNLKALKMPWLFGTTPENRKKMQQLWYHLDDDDPVLWVDIEDVNNLKILSTGAPVIFDKLEVKRQQAEDEVNTQLGFNSVGIMEKKEHLTTGEVEMNGEASAASNDIYLDCLLELFGRVENVLHHHIVPSLNQPEMWYNEEGENKESKEEEEVEDE